nr:hypothetical protein [Roseofilum reptotaenium]
MWLLFLVMGTRSHPWDLWESEVQVDLDTMIGIGHTGDLHNPAFAGLHNPKS